MYNSRICKNKELQGLWIEEIKNIYGFSKMVQICTKVIRVEDRRLKMNGK